MPMKFFVLLVTIAISRVSLSVKKNIINVSPLNEGQVALRYVIQVKVSLQFKWRITEMSDEPQAQKCRLINNEEFSV